MDRRDLSTTLRMCRDDPDRKRAGHHAIHWFRGSVKITDDEEKRSLTEDLDDLGSECTQGNPTEKCAIGLKNPSRLSRIRRRSLAFLV